MKAKKYLLGKTILRANRAAWQIDRTVFFEIVKTDKGYKLMDEETGKFHIEGKLKEIESYLLGYAKALEEFPVVSPMSR